MTKAFVKVLIDSSGSMLHAKSATVAGYNNYVGTLDKDSTVSVAIFATPYGLKRIHTNVVPAYAKLNPDDYPCIGGTPLYDAIGRTIQEIDTEAKEYDRVILVIQTDGAETGESTEFTMDMVRKLLADKQEGEGWLVVFLGAGVDSMAQAAAIGIRRTTSASYATGQSMQAFAAVSRSTASYTMGSNRGEAIQNASFTDEERNRIK